MATPHGSLVLCLPRLEYLLWFKWLILVVHSLSPSLKLSTLLLLNSHVLLVFATVVVSWLTGSHWSCLLVFTLQLGIFFVLFSSP